jgi:hypothetical protein
VLLRTLELYPQSANAHFELAESYLSSNDMQRAQAHMTRSLELFPGNANARKALKDLGMDADRIVPQTKLPERSLRKHAGRYRSGDEITTIALEEGRLFATIGRDPRRELRARSETQFYALDNDVDFTFHKDKGGTRDAVAIQFADGSFVSEREK